MENTLENDYKNRIAVDGTKYLNEQGEREVVSELEKQVEYLMKQITEINNAINELKKNISLFNGLVNSGDLNLPQSIIEKYKSSIQNNFELLISKSDEYEATIDLIKQKISGWKMDSKRAEFIETRQN